MGGRCASGVHELQGYRRVRLDHLPARLRDCLRHPRPSTGQLRRGDVSERALQPGRSCQQGWLRHVRVGRRQERQPLSFSKPPRQSFKSRLVISNFEEHRRDIVMKDILVSFATESIIKPKSIFTTTTNLYKHISALGELEHSPLTRAECILGLSTVRGVHKITTNNNQAVRT